MRVCVEFLKRKEKIEARTHTFERKPPHKRYSIFFFFIRKDLALYESIDTGDKRNKRQGRKKHKDHWIWNKREKKRYKEKPPFIKGRILV